MKIILNGALGRMGTEIRKLIEQGFAGSSLAAAVDINSNGENGVYNNINDFKGDADVIIDFTHHSATNDLLKYAYVRNIPVVIATTGHTEDELKLIYDTSKVLPIFFSANMSIGIAMLCKFAKCTAQMLPDADIEIVEIHHTNKLDAPSGTALMIANEIKTVRTDAEIICGRSGYGKPLKNEIGINALRLSNVVGVHEVIISSPSQTITLKHEAHNRQLLAEGAVTAAQFLIKQKCGLYNIKDTIEI